jgi:YfiH family protein
MMIMIIDEQRLFIQPTWPAPKHIKAFTSLRASQVYHAPLEVDEPRLKDLLNLPNNPIRLRQTHSNIAKEATTDNAKTEGDGLFTHQPLTVCAMLTADCLPLLVTNQAGTAVAAIHAGWRGLASGIIESTLLGLNIPPEDCLVWLGPAIGPSQFEVRSDVYQAFVQHNPAAQHAFVSIGKDHWHANLFALATLRLNAMGIDQIYGGDYCTYSDKQQFFSYRRDGKETGRLVSLIWIDDQQ